MPSVTLTLQLNAGYHYINDPITITNRGRGEGKIVLKGIGANYTTITSTDFGSYNTNQPMITLYESSIYMEDLSFNGESQTGPLAISAVGNAVLYLTNVSVVSFIQGVALSTNAVGVITDCEIFSCSDTGLIAGDSKFVLYNVDFMNCGTSIFLNRSNLTAQITTILVSSSDHTGIALRNSSSALFMNGSSIAAVTNKYAIDCQDNSHFMG
jgi:hypothetical protein